MIFHHCLVSIWQLEKKGGPDIRSAVGIVNCDAAIGDRLLLSGHHRKHLIDHRQSRGADEDNENTWKNE